jgi:hypothetical protein
MAKLTTGIVRLSYANIAQPRKNDDGKAKYSSQIIIDKTDKKTIKAFERAIEELKADPKAVADQPETYAGKFFINANSDKQPIVFTRDKIKMDQFDIEEEIYSGVYAQVALSVFAYNFNGKKGVGFGLNGVRKVKDGDRLGGVHVSASDFGDDDLGDLDDDDLI